MAVPCVRIFPSPSTPYPSWPNAELGIGAQEQTTRHAPLRNLGHQWGVGRIRRMECASICTPYPLRQITGTTRIPLTVSVATLHIAILHPIPRLLNMSQGSTGSTWPHRDPNNGLLWRIEEDLSRTYYNPTSKSIKVPVKDTHKWTGPGDLTYSARGQLVQPRTTISIGGDAQSTSDIHTSGSDNSVSSPVYDQRSRGAEAPQSGSSSNGRNNVHIATVSHDCL